MNRSFSKSAAARLAVIVVALLMVLMVGTTGPVGAQDAPVPQVSVEAPSAIVEASPTPAATVPQVSVEAPSATPEVIVQTAEQAEVLTVNGVSVMSTDPTIDESGWVECRQTSGTQSACQGRVERKLGRLGFALPDWTDPDGAVTYMAGLFYENRPDKHVISDCTRQMSALWDKGTCWVHPATPTPPATSTPTETPEPPTSTPTATNTSTPEPTATGTFVPTATATQTAVPTNTAMPTATATATSQAPTVTPTRGDPWIGHSLTLGSFCAPTGGEGPIGQLPGQAISAYVGTYMGPNDGSQEFWWGGDNAANGWTQTTQLSYGQAPRVWSYATSVATPLVGWYFVDPATGLVAERAQEPEVGFRMGGERDSKWLASLHDCVQPVPTGTPPPAPDGEQPAALRGNGAGKVDPRGIALGVIVFIAGVLTALIGLVVAAMVAAKRGGNASQKQQD